MLDDAECEKARVGRDPAYDGRFFTGCRTTGIYCRPVCPVRPAHPRNVCFFPSAAAAEAAGFRPCLRCRPEAAPFSPAWLGSRVTAERAARLIIEEGALDGDGANVERLAARVGVGARHLARLFAKHLGATPSQVAKTARVQRAKRLLDRTDLPMTEIALRRVSVVFDASTPYLRKSTGGRPPTSGEHRAQSANRDGNKEHARSAWELDGSRSLRDH